MEDANPNELDRPKRVRRTHSKVFKARLVALAESGNMSVAQIALDNRINANQLRRWMNEAHPVKASQKMLPVSVADIPAEVSVTTASTVVMELTISGSAIRIHHTWDPQAVATLIRSLQ